MSPLLAAEAAGSFSTPGLVVDLETFEQNVEAMAGLLAGTGKTVRPHVKTHRTPELARRQLGGPAVGVTCSTVGEAEAMVAAGIDDVFLANELVDPVKIDRLVSLAHTAKVSVAVDDPAPVTVLSDHATRQGVGLSVLIDIDILLHRCGVSSVSDALALAALVERSPGLHLVGLMGYEGRIRKSVPDRAAKISAAFAVLAEVADALRHRGFAVERVSAAGTSTLTEALADPTITELQAGVYALMEPELVNLGLPFHCATTIRGTVISRHPGRFVLDIGRRAVGMEYGPPISAGFEASRISLGDEHTIVTVSGEPPALGTELALIPAQIRTTFNLHDHVWVRRNGSLVDVWPISARGSSQ